VSAPNIGAWADAFSFVADMRREENRPKLLTGVFTGYMTAILLGGLALAAQHFHLLPQGPWFYSVLGLKLLTNTLAWIGLRTRLLGITFSGANVIADIFVMTAAIYFTGGQLSPLVPIYFVETTVMALLSNVSLTVITVLLSFCFYAVMAVLVHAGVLVAHPPPLNASAAITLPYLLCDLAFVAGVLFGPGTYIALIVQRLRQKEAALEEHARELAQASKLKSQFMANITHELRTPIHGVLGLTEMLSEEIYGPISGNQREAIDGIRQSANNLLELIDALLLLARSEVAKLELHVDDTAIGEVVNSVATAGRWMCGKRALEVNVELEEGLPSVATDRAKLAQVLLNLVANAIKFTPDGGRVTLAAHRGVDGSVEIAVTDTGIGISATELPHIFDEFRQVDGSSSRTYGGAGLGLAVVKKLTELLSAKVRVESSSGEGSTFTVWLPARALPQPAVSA